MCQVPGSPYFQAISPNLGHGFLFNRGNCPIFLRISNIFSQLFTIFFGLSCSAWCLQMSFQPLGSCAFSSATRRWPEWTEVFLACKRGSYKCIIWYHLPKNRWYIYKIYLFCMIMYNQCIRYIIYNVYIFINLLYHFHWSKLCSSSATNSLWEGRCCKDRCTGHDRQEAHSARGKDVALGVHPNSLGGRLRIHVSFLNELFLLCGVSFCLSTGALFFSPVRWASAFWMTSWTTLTAPCLAVKWSAPNWSPGCFRSCKKLPRHLYGWQCWRVGPTDSIVEGSDWLVVRLWPSNNLEATTMWSQSTKAIYASTWLISQSIVPGESHYKVVLAFQAGLFLVHFGIVSWRARQWTL